MKFLSSPFVMPVGVIIYSIAMCCYSPPPLPSNSGEAVVQTPAIQIDEREQEYEPTAQDSFHLTNFAVSFEPGDLPPQQYSFVLR
jgi:hypothetical protein